MISERKIVQGWLTVPVTVELEADADVDLAMAGLTYKVRTSTSPCFLTSKIVDVDGETVWLTEDMQGDSPTFEAGAF